jgi:hypothetical protein
MARNQHNKRPTDQEKQERRQLSAVIAKHVIHNLGQPGGLHAVQVRWLWENRYRVNVFIGHDVASARIANSYFLVADGDGNILESTPQITKQY